MTPGRRRAAPRRLVARDVSCFANHLRMRQATPELIALDQYSSVDSIRHQWDAVGVYREEKSRAAARFRLRPNSSTMLFYEQQQGRSRRYATDELALESQKCTQTFLC